MRYILFVLLIFYGTLVVAQVPTNRFDNGNQTDVVAAERIPGDPGSDDEDGELEDDDPLPVPIDDYIPLLIITALGLIIYNTHTREKKMLPDFFNFYRNR